jgi:hypothetical protein
LGQQIDRPSGAFRAGPTSWLKGLQLAVSIGAFVLSWLVFPGVLMLFAALVGLAYVAAAIAAAYDKLIGIWAAFAFSLFALAACAWGVYRYLDNGFDYLAGNFDNRAGFYWPAYLFLVVTAIALAVVVLHVVSWRWMLHPQQRRDFRARAQ